MSGCLCRGAGVGAPAPRSHEHLDHGVAALLFGGVALYLATFGYSNWRVLRRLPLARLVSAGVILAMLPFATQVPALLALLDLAVVLMLLTIIEYAHRGRRSRKIAEAQTAPDELVPSAR